MSDQNSSSFDPTASGRHNISDAARVEPITSSSDDTGAGLSGHHGSTSSGVGLAGHHNSDSSVPDSERYDILRGAAGGSHGGSTPYGGATDASTTGAPQQSTFDYVKSFVGLGSSTNAASTTTQPSGTDHVTASGTGTETDPNRTFDSGSTSGLANDATHHSRLQDGTQSQSGIGSHATTGHSTGTGSHTEHGVGREAEAAIAPGVASGTSNELGTQSSEGRLRDDTTTGDRSHAPHDTGITHGSHHSVHEGAGAATADLTDNTTAGSGPATKDATRKAAEDSAGPPPSIPTAGGERIGTKHWGESKVIPENPPRRQSDAERRGEAKGVSSAAGQSDDLTQKNTTQNTGTATEQGLHKESKIEKLKEKLHMAHKS